MSEQTNASAVPLPPTGYDHTTLPMPPFAGVAPGVNYEDPPPFEPMPAGEWRDVVAPPCTLIEALTAKLTEANARLHDAEVQVAALEVEIANVPDWAKTMTAGELALTVERWFSGLEPRP